MSAVEFAARGWKVFPLAPRTKVPHPSLSRNGYKCASSDVEEVSRWSGKDVNVGIACAASGLIVIDVDQRNAPDQQVVDQFPATFTVGTADGHHLYYAIGEGKYRGKVGDGIDVKYNGYVVAAGSIHPDGPVYHVIDWQDPVPFPAHLRHLIERQS